MRNKWIWLVCVMCIGLVLGLITMVVAEEKPAAAEAKPVVVEKSAVAADDPEKLAKEFEEATAASAKDKPTTDMVIKKVDQACELLKKEGKAAFPKFKGKNSEFIFAGTYIWIHDMQGVMRVHPIKYKLDGKPVIAMKDTKGKLFFAEMNSVAKEKGAGWVQYMWPKPGEKEGSRKVSYVKLCKTVDGEELVVGCGVYDLSDDDIKKLGLK